MTKKNLGQKLLEFHQKVGSLSKDRTAAGGSFKYRYLDINAIIEEVKPILNDCGIVMAQPLDMVEGNLVMTTKLINADDWQDEMSYSCPLPVLNAPQEQGKVITYYRRYCIQSMLCLQAEDNDAKKANDSVSYNQVQKIYNLASEEKVLKCLQTKDLDCVDQLTYKEANDLIDYLKRNR
jgi:hypothetical protein